MHNRDSVIGAMLLGGLMMVSGAVLADMEPMSEEEMGSVTGQAMLGLDVNQTAEADFTRYTVGTRSELQMNMEEMALGEDGTGSDVAVDHLSLGHIARQQGEQFDGNTYDANEIVPFVGLDPYLELAENDGNVVGFRMGFTESRGTLSGSIQSLTGRLGIELEDTNDGTVQDGELLQSDGTANNQRATHFGLADSADCSTQTDCAPLSAIQTLEVGERDADGNAAFTNDFFISFQNQGLDWESPGDATGTVSTDSGVFINIPTAMRLDLQSLQNDTVVPRERTEYIDRGQGLF
ncbi:hypothetical protein DES49_2188 [Halospina denitrificans]|uniref:DUF6160 domain-containing protein n=1 Tax=Halospina denitrificans TaxID=332522 RepID=A0A4R7JMI8_9GAMM|nr:DUF6160 family protein [Halospina denitrificans]TDT39270.1 hypothetical protein DES49_2188 [Halospina denitrificans]